MGNGGPCVEHMHHIVGNGGHGAGVAAGNECNKGERDYTAACLMVNDTAWADVGRWAERVPQLPRREPLVVCRRECAPGEVVAVAFPQLGC